MDFSYGWSRMPLGVISRVSFGFWGDFEEKLQRCKNWKIWHYRASTPQRREPTLRRKPMPRRGIPHRAERRGAEMASLGYSTAKHCCATA